MENKLDLHEQAEQLQQEYCRLQVEGAEQAALEIISEKYFQVLEEIRNDELRDEIEWAAVLIEYGAVEPNVFNTFEWVNNCIQQLENPLETSTFLANVYPSINEWKTPDFVEESYIFDDLWKGLDTLNCYGQYRSNQGDFSQWKEYKENGVYFNPLHYLLATIRGGGIPAPELLLSLAKAFDLYFSRGGELTLEEVFFGKPTRLGNYAKRFTDSYKGIDFKQLENCIRRKEYPSIEKTAERFIEVKMIEEPENGLSKEDLESLLRKYRRWKNRTYTKK